MPADDKGRPPLPLQAITGSALRPLCEDLRVERNVCGPDAPVGGGAQGVPAGLGGGQGNLQVREASTLNP